MLSIEGEGWGAKRKWQREREDREKEKERREGVQGVYRELVQYHTRQSCHRSLARPIRYFASPLKSRLETRLQVFAESFKEGGLPGVTVRASRD